MSDFGDMISAVAPFVVAGLIASVILVVGIAFGLGALTHWALS